MKKALITGLNGQDGSYLAEFLLAKGYQVVGTVRSKTPAWPYGFNPHQPNLEILQVDLGYSESIRLLFNAVGHVDEVYNLAAQSHVGYSFENPEETYKVTGVGACLMMDEFFRNFPAGKFYQASSSEMFGDQEQSINGFDWRDDYLPVSPYGVAKVMAHFGASSHRKHGKFACAGILFNHESERRPDSFVTQKIVKYVALAKACNPGIVQRLKLGNIFARRDWGYAPEYVEIMWNIMQKEEPNEYVVGTGIATSVLSFAQKAFEYVGLDWADFTITESPYFTRPHDIACLRANPIEADKLLGKELTNVDGLVKIMMDHQLKVQGVEK